MPRRDGWPPGNHGGRVATVPMPFPRWNRGATAAVTFGVVVGESRHCAGTEVPPPPRPSLAVPMHSPWPQAPSSCATRSSHCATTSPCHRTTVTVSLQHGAARPRGACTARSITRPDHERARSAGLRQQDGFPHPAPPCPTPAPGPPENLGPGGSAGEVLIFFTHIEARTRESKPFAYSASGRRGSAPRPCSRSGRHCWHDLCQVSARRRPTG